MGELERYKHYILDNVNSIIINTENMKTTTFDFEDMSYHDANKRSQRKPIRYNVKNEQILKWASQCWNTYSVNDNEAILRLFNNYHERVILGN